MANWTPAHSVLLSELLDDVVGTEEIVHIRQDYCRIYDCIMSTRDAISDTFYYTGSRAEGLDLPGSDDDGMFNINNEAKLLIIENMQDAPTEVQRNVFFMKTENVPQCFVMLRSVNQVRNGMLLEACQSIDNAMYLSSYLLVHNVESECNKMQFGGKIARQGPSIERWTPYMDTSQSGIDAVLSIHCPFWPDSASEWRTRPRQSAWPSPTDIKYIVDFGFHLVPVGHPNSDMNMMEWRISFSVAERTLVWSFNHVQVKCYAGYENISEGIHKSTIAVLITVYCALTLSRRSSFGNTRKRIPPFGVQETSESALCSCCLVSVIPILRSSLKHYFIPEFNLLSVRMTAEARWEILRVLGIMLQSDISFIKTCNTLRPIWDQFVNYTNSRISHDSVRSRQTNLLKTDACLASKLLVLKQQICDTDNSNLLSLIYQFVSQSFKNIQTTSLVSFAVQIVLFRLSNNVVGNKYYRATIGNKTFYRPCRYLHLNICGIDISTNRLWCAMLMTMRGNYSLSLVAIHIVLSSTPPFALYCSSAGDLRGVSNETKTWYVDEFSSNLKSATERTRKAWMFDIVVKPADIDTVPVAIQIELTHCDKDVGVKLSPFICAYYLMFFNYHALRQYENRDRALGQLIETVNNREQCGTCKWHSYNIAGHCLLYMGRYEQARDMFIRSYQFTYESPPHHRFNSAILYLQCLPL